MSKRVEELRGVEKLSSCRHENTDELIHLALKERGKGMVISD